MQSEVGFRTKICDRKTNPSIAKSITRSFSGKKSIKFYGRAL